MTTQLTGSDIWKGYLALQYLRLELDFSMWLCIEFENKPGPTIISLVKEPRAALEAAARIYVAKHGADLQRYWECPDCARVYLYVQADNACPRRLGTSDGKECGATLTEGFRQYNEKQLREHSQHVMAREGNFAATRNTVSAWLVEKSPRTSGDVKRTLRDVRIDLDRMMRGHVADFDRAGSSFDLDFHGRASLLPLGESIQVKYIDYMSLWDKVVSVQRRLCAEAGRTPELIEDEEFPHEPHEPHARPVSPPPPLGVVSLPGKPSASATEPFLPTKPVRADTDDDAQKSKSTEVENDYVFRLGKLGCNIVFEGTKVKDVPLRLGAKYAHFLISRHASGGFKKVHVLELTASVNPTPANKKARQAYLACDQGLSSVFQDHNKEDYEEIEQQIGRANEALARQAAEGSDDPAFNAEIEDDLEALKRVKRIFEDAKLGSEKRKASKSATTAITRWIEGQIEPKSKSLGEHLNDSVNWKGSYIWYKPRECLSWTLE